MNVESAASMLAGSILTVLTLVVFVIGAIAINNILHKYWKPVRIFTADSWNIIPAPTRFIEPTESVVDQPTESQPKSKNERTT